MVRVLCVLKTWGVPAVKTGRKKERVGCVLSQESKYLKYKINLIKIDIMMMKVEQTDRHSYFRMYNINVWNMDFVFTYQNFR